MLDNLTSLVEKHKGKIIGTSLGFITSLLIIILGFFKVLFIAVCVYIGFYLGEKIDNDEDIVKLLEKIFPLK